MSEVQRPFRDALLRVLTGRGGGLSRDEREARRIAVLETAKPIAFSGDVYAELTAALRRQGYAGDARTAELLYTVLSSRLLKRPMSALVRLPPYAARPCVVDRVVRMLSEDQVETRSGFSARAIAYKWRDLSHKALVVREAGGLSGRDGGMLMSGLAEQRIRWEAPRWSGGSPTTTDIVRKGPLALIMMTSAETVRPELDTVPALPVTIEDTAERAASDIEEISREFAGQTVDAHELDPWRAFQEILETTMCRVVVPFAPALGRLFRGKPEPVRRLYPQLLAAIATSALLHQFTSERDATGAVIATFADYAHARRLLEPSFEEVARPDIPDVVDELLDVLCQNPQGVDLGELATKLAIDRATAHRRARKAKALGLAADLAGGRGRRSRWVAVQRSPADECALPDVRVVQAEMRDDEHVQAAPHPRDEPPELPEPEIPTTEVEKEDEPAEQRSSSVGPPEERPRPDDSLIGALQRVAALRAEREVNGGDPPADRPERHSPIALAPATLGTDAEPEPVDLNNCEVNAAPPTVLPEAAPPATAPLAPGAKPVPPIVSRAPNPNSLTGGYRLREDQFKFRAAMQEITGRRWGGTNSGAPRRQ